MTIAPYLAELADPSREVSVTALTRLSGLLGEELDELRERWEEIPTPRRQEAVVRMVELAEENVELDFYAVFCHAMTDDEDTAVRERAVSGLWETDDRRTIPKLIDRLENDTDGSVRAASAVVLAHFALLADAGKLIRHDRERVYQALMAALEDEDETLEVRRRALESVAPFHTPEVAEWVHWGYRSDDRALRQSSLFAMGRSCDPAWLPFIYREMLSTDPAMRFEAANAAGELAEEEAVPSVAELVRDADRQVAMAALQALGGIGGQEAKKLLRGFAALSEDEVIREAAEEALRALQTDEADFSMLGIDRIDGQS